MALIKRVYQAESRNHRISSVDSGNVTEATSTYNVICGLMSTL